MITFKKIRAEALYLGDTNNCSLVAVSIATQTEYNEVFDLFLKHGRFFFEGASLIQIEMVLSDLGFQLVRNDVVKSRYRIKTVKTLSKAAPRFDRPILALNLCRSGGHIMAVHDGEVQDWSVIPGHERNFRIAALYHLKELKK